MFCKKGTRYRAKMAGNLLLNGCLFILLLTICDGGANSGVLAASSSNNGSRVLRSMLEQDNYDKRFRPNFEGAATTVKLSLFISAIGGLNEKEMEFQVTMFMRQTWIDPRLTFGKQYTKRNLTLTGNIINQIWKPDTVISNEKTLNVPEHEFLLRINSDGTVLYSQKMSVVASCKMDLRNFPMDTQKCGLIFESYGSTTEDLTFEWDPALSNPVVKASDLFMGQFAIDDMIYTDNLMVYSSGTFSGLKLEFLLRRKKFYYVVQTYIPTMLIVVLSWVSFWIPRSSPPARVALGITTVLALTTLIFGIQSSMPKVSYVKGIDWFLMVSFLYVFAALIEYPSSTFITFQAKKITRTGNTILRKVKGERDEGDTEGKPSTKYGSTNNSSKDRELCDLRRLDRNSKGGEEELEAEKEVCNGRAKLSREQTYNDDYLDNFVDDRRSNTVDRYARLAFPVTYFLYNVCYWAVYLTV